MAAARRVRDADLDGVEMAAHVRRVDMRDWNIEARTRPGYFFGGRHDRHRTAEGLPHRVAARDVPERPMLDLTRRADEILLALAMTTGPRVHNRAGGLEASQIKGLDGLR